MSGRKFYDDDYDDGYYDDVGGSYESTGMSPSVVSYMYKRSGGINQDNDDEDLIDKCIFAVEDVVGEELLENYNMQTLTDLVRHFDYNEELLIEYILKEADKKSGKKAGGSGMFDFDEDSPNASIKPKGQSSSLKNQKGNPSSLAQHLSSESSTKKQQGSQSNNVNKLNQFLHPQSSDIVPFGFDEPSPDDIASDKQGKAFTRGGSASKSTESPKNNQKSVPSIIVSGKPSSASAVKVSGPIIAGGKKTAHLPASGSSSDTKIKNTEKSIKNLNLSSDNAVDNRDSLTSSSSSNLTVSGEVLRSGSKPKMVKQMPEAKREKVLKELLIELGMINCDQPSSTTPTVKSHLNMVVIGHVDSGKSTTMGHLLFQLGHVEKKTIDKFEHESKGIGKATFHFAWVLDEQAEERSRGVTIDVAVQHFETPKHKITILDAPGHQDFVPNMISGAAQADVGVLVVNASDAEYQSILELGQAREHIMLARSLGVMQLIVAVNKLDTAEWKQERFEFVKELLLPFLKKSGFKETALQFVPTSGLSGENLTKQNEPKLLSWYHGPTLFDAINNFGPAKRDVEKPFRMSISDVFKDPHSLGITIAGKVESGFITTGDKLSHLPFNQICSIKGIRVGSSLVERACAGTNVEIGLLDIEMSTISIGDVLCDPMAPVTITDKFQAQVVTFDLNIPIIKGQNVIYYAANMNEPAVITKLLGICDNSGEIKQKNPRALTSKVTALIEIQMKRKIPVELYRDYRGFGRFTIRDQGKTLGAGIITQLHHGPPPASSPSS